MVDDYTKYYKDRQLFSMKDYFVETLTVVRRESLKLNKKLCIGIQIFSCLQVLSIIFDPKESNSLPWNYSSLDILWIAIGLITRPYLILEHLNVSILALILIPLGYLLMVALYGLIFIHVRRRISPVENITIVEHRYIQLIKIESLLRYLLLDAGYLSVLLFHRYLFRRIIEKDGDLEYSVCLFILITLLYLPLIYTKGYYLMALKWNTQAYNTMSHPQPYFYYKLAYMGLVYSTVEISFADRPVEYSIVFMICGVYLVVLFAYIQPYVQFIVNYLQCLKGVALFLAGLIMFIFSISDNLDQSSYAATITFFAVMPFLGFFMKEIMIRRRNYVLNKLNLYSNAYECFIKIQEHRNQHYAMIPDQDNFMTDVIQIRKAQKRNFYVHIWLLYYLLDAENWGGVCLFLSKIRRLTRTIQQRSFVQEFKEEFYKSVKHNKEIMEAIDFISYRKKISSLDERDKMCCYAVLRIYEQLAASKDIHTLSRCIVQFLVVFKETKEVYSSLLKAYHKTSEVLQSYVDFLKIIENNELKANTTTLKELNSEAKALERNGGNFINTNGLVLVVSLEQRSLGYVIMVHNPEKFGYISDQLEGESYFKLFPNEIKKYLKAIQAKSMNYFYLHDLFISTQSLYILSKNNYLEAVNVKFRVTNTQFNDLCGVVTFVRDKKGVEIALLSDDGRRIIHIVKYT